MSAPTPEERASWRADAERVALSSCCFLAGQPGHGPGEHRPFYDERILALLDALNAAEAALAGAWDQGYGARVSDEQVDDERTDNPYRPAPPWSLPDTSSPKASSD